MEYLRVMFFENAKLLYYSEILKAIGKFIRKEAYAFSDFAKLDPMFSVQLMYNAYCDGPLREAAEKYMASSGSIRSNLYLQSNSAPYQSNSVIRDKLQGHDWCVRDVAVSDDFKRALSVSDDSTCILWDLDTGIMLRLLSMSAFPNTFECITKRNRSIKRTSCSIPAFHCCGGGP